LEALISAVKSKAVVWSRLGSHAPKITQSIIILKNTDAPDEVADWPDNPCHGVQSFDSIALALHRDLVLRMAAGDQEAMRQLYEIHADRVGGIIGRILNDHGDIQEAVQDTFVKAWRKAPTYRPERGEVISWLVFVARSAAIDRLRRTSRRQALFSSLPEEEPAPESARSGVEDQEFLDRQLGELSEAQRQAMRLAFFEGCTQAEIAQRMKIPVGNVKNHLRRGLLKLRQRAPRHD
jgi:RNA polymerase sigma-70 factor, ECF subfamily